MSFSVCSNGHEEVCYTSRYCPVCEEIEKNDDYIKELDLRDDIISELKEQ